MSTYSAFNTISPKNNSLIYSSDDDDEDIERLVRINGSQKNRTQQHAVVTPKAASKMDWNDDDHLDSRNSALPPALLKLDQQRAIPTLRHCNDILIEVEACTIDSQKCMNRSGLRGGNRSSKKDGSKADAAEAAKDDHNNQDKSMEVETTSGDCIGRVVQLAENDSYFIAQQQQNPQPQQQKIHHNIRVGDRIAAIYPFEYKLDKKNQLLLSRQNNHNISDHQKYTLVDAGNAVKIPGGGDHHRNNAASAACMTRVYTTAFQSLQLGLSPASVMSSYLTNQRYSLKQLHEKSILIQDGTSELGRAWIQLSKALGATHIFATGNTSEELLILRDELNVTPLASDSFSSGLFTEEKLNLVLIQDLPSCHDFEMYYSILDDARGVLVYCPRDDDGGSSSSGVGNNESGGNGNEEELFGDLGNLASVGCTTSIPSFQDVVNKAWDVVAMTKFSLRLTCSPQFVTYRGAWASYKEDHGLFRKDLTFLFKLLEEGKLKPHVEECISPEDIPSARNKIELEGKRGTVVCLPAPLYEKKAVNVVSPINSPEDTTTASKWNEHMDGGMVMNAESYAADSGYVVNHYKSFADAAAVTTDEDLSDFNNMNGTGGQPSPFRPRLPSNGSDSLQLEPAQSFSTFTSVSSVSVKAHEFLRDYNLLGRK